MGTKYRCGRKSARCFCRHKRVHPKGATANNRYPAASLDPIHWNKVLDSESLLRYQRPTLHNGIRSPAAAPPHPCARALPRAPPKSPSTIMSLKLTPEAWAQVRYKYEHTDEPVDDICLDHGIS